MISKLPLGANKPSTTTSPAMQASIGSVGEDATVPVLVLDGITKHFGALAANQDISLSLSAGEIVALLGENGAGKTTLMNILFGHYRADSGSIDAFGIPLEQHSPEDALARGIGMVHQHFTLADNLTVLDNILLGTESLWQPFSRRGAARAKLLKIMREAGLSVNMDSPVRALTVGERQRVEILKALYRNVRILILDEPTAVLTPQEVDDLFVLLRSMAAQGLAIIIISHKLQEVMAISDRVVVLRGREIINTPALHHVRPVLNYSLCGPSACTRKGVSDVFSTQSICRYGPAKLLALPASPATARAVLPMCYPDYALLMKESLYYTGRPNVNFHRAH